MKNEELVQEINKNLAILLPNEISLDELHIRLSEYLNQLIHGYFTQSLPAFQRKVYHPKGGVEACSNLVNFFGS
jgi:hypothetical protein